MRRLGFLLPEEIEGHELVCVQIKIPNVPEYRRAFFGHIWQLGKYFNWEQTDDDDARANQAARYWNQLLFEHMLLLDEDCGEPTSVHCQDFFPTSPRIEWNPVSPYEPDAELPDGYIYHPWTIVTSPSIGTFLGFQVGDVFTDLSKLPVGFVGNPLDAPIFNWPRFRITGLNGVGTVKIHLLNIIQGGGCLITVDDDINPLTWTLLELNRDEIKLPPETTPVIIIEREITSLGEHHIDVTFLPQVDDTLIPFFFGGGLHKIEICGFGVDEMSPCCPDEIQEQRALRRQQDRLYAHSLELLDDHTTPQSFAPNTKAEWSDGTNLQTNLCSMLEDFIFESLVARTQGFADVITPVTDVLHFMPLFGAQLLDGLGDITLDHMNQLVGDQSARSKVACCMYDFLKDADVSLENWEDALSACSFTFPDPEAEIAGIVALNLTEVNYRAFVRELSVQVPAGAANDNCACACENPPVVQVGTLVDNGGGSYTITSEDWDSSHVAVYGQPERVGWPTIRYTLPGCCTIISGTVDDAGTGGGLIGYYVDCDDGVYEAPGVYFPPLDTSYKMYVGYRAHEDSTPFEITIILDGS